MKVEEIDYVFYHSPCADGHYAAWVLYNKGLPLDKLIPVTAGKAPENLDTLNIVDKTILCVDYCPPLDFLENEKFKLCLVLDHHKTGDEILQQVKSLNVEFVMDLNRSGCQITWDYFNNGAQRPELLNYVADRDLWQWKLKNSKGINVALHLYGIEIEQINTAIGNPNIINEFTTNSSIILNVYANEMDHDEKYAIVAECHGHNIWLATCASHLRSDLGDRLSDKPLPTGEIPSFAAIWSYSPIKDEFRISLRGSSSSELDLTTIAKIHGGGGHKSSAGCAIKRLNDMFTF